MSKELDTAIIAAKKAGKVLMKFFKTQLKITQKKDKSFVTNADLAAENIILKTLNKEFPKYSFYSEEKGASKNKSEYCWYIDPLDGTHNFLHKLPLFATSIALAKGNKFILGVIYLPITDELFYAEKGRGAFLNGKRIFVSKNKLLDSMCFLPGGVTHNKGDISKLVKISENYCKDIRIIGSCAISLVYLASGRSEFYIKSKITPHDTGAGKVILEEAGGKLTQIDGKEFTTKSNNFIASNNVFHKELLEIMKNEGF